MTAPAISRPYFDGEERPGYAGPVTVVVQCVRVGHSYRVSIRHTSTNAEVGELSKSHATEDGAREHATTALLMFRSGVTVAEALDMQATKLNPACPLAPGEIRVHRSGATDVRVFETPAGGFLVQVRESGAIVRDACRHHVNETPALAHYARLVAATEV